MSIPQMEQDTLDVVNYLRNRFKRKKIFVIGHSWGSVLGLWLAHEHPETIYAYVGTGQVINMRQNEELAYRDALQQARNYHNEQAAKELESIAPYPPSIPDLDKLGTAKKWEAAVLGPLPTHEDEFLDLTRIVSAPEYSLADDLNFFRGQLLSAKTLFPELMKVELNKLGSDFYAPVFFFEGTLDPYCRPSLVWDYNHAINAPQKKFVWFDHSGHYPFFEEQQKFTDELVERVLPLASPHQSR